MKSIRFLLRALSAMAALFLFTSTSYSNEIQCENWSPAEWDRYLDKDLLRPGAHTEEIYNVLLGLKKKCATSISTLGLEPCLERTLGYYKQFSINNVGRTFSRVMNDDEYLASQPQDVMQIPQEFRNGLPANWREISKRKGWKYALFHSGSGSSGRLIFQIPGEKYNRLLLYADLGDPPSNDPTTYDHVQMQAIEKTDPKSNSPAKYYFREWKVEESNKPPVLSTRGGTCIECHFSGPRAIEPIANPSFKSELGGVKNLQAFNDLIIHKGPLDFSLYYDLKNFPSHLKIGERVCSGCHGSGKERHSLAFSVGSLTGSLSRESIYRKVVREASMPILDGESLSADEREKLVNFLISDHREKLKGWLIENKCSSISTQGNQQPQNPIPKKTDPPATATR